MQHQCLFLPRPWLGADEALVTTHESIGGDAGEALRCQFLFRANDESVYVKGSIKQADHETIWLPYWHQVVMNARSRRSVALLD